jgi:hypothetical protein
MRNSLYRVEYQEPGQDRKTWEGAASDCFDALRSAACRFGVSSLDVYASNVRVEFVKELGKPKD